MILLELLDIVSQDVALTIRGREAWGCCPFHGEKTPSFSVNLDKQIFYCFGCGAKGDAITYLRKHRGLSYQRAAEIVGKGLPLAPVHTSPTQRALEATRARYHEWEARTLDLITQDYWHAWDLAETVELHMALALVQHEPATAEEWEAWQRRFDAFQQDCWRALEQIAFFQHPATTAERVRWWEQEEESA